MDIITTALPYANGPLHCGHILEAILADIYVRYLRSISQDVVFLSGQDAHGVAITISAHSLGESEEEYIKKMHELHQETYRLAHISFDIFTTTHSVYNKKTTEYFYNTMCQAGVIKEVMCRLPYDPVERIFLADRFLKGTCPSCKAADQYGDHCESCGATYTSDMLIDPVSRVSQEAITWQERSHHVVDLEYMRDTLWRHLETMECHVAVKNKLQEWFETTLRHWDITRDGPYFGFPIPGRDDQYFYVWVDAPCGYVSALGEHKGIDDLAQIKDIWNASRVTHVIGKDITYFHGLFWPAMLASSGFHMPDALICHGFVTKDGHKMSKSKGTFIVAQDILTHIPADALRYYFATKLSPGLHDIDISCDDFIDRIHSDLIGKCINLGSRLSGFVHKYGDGLLAEPMDVPFLQDIQASLSTLHAAYKNWDFAEVTRILMRICHSANQWIDQHQPWIVAKTDTDKAWRSASTALQVYRWVLMGLRPICPILAAQGLELFLQHTEDTMNFTIIDGRIQSFVPLLTRFERDTLRAVFGEHA